MLDLEKALPSTTPVDPAPAPALIHVDILPNRKPLWYKVASITGLICVPFFYGQLSKHEAYIRENIPAFPLILLFSVNLSYLILITCLYVRQPPPHVLPRSHKLSIESAFVVACSCWTFFERDGDIFTAILGLVLLFKLIPIMNVWWDFENFDLCDCYLALLVDAALVCCRYFGGVVLMVVVACVGVALHFVKDAYPDHFLDYDYPRRKEVEIEETQIPELIWSLEQAYLWARSLTPGRAARRHLYSWTRWGGVEEKGLTEILF